MTYFAYVFCVITILSFLWFGRSWILHPQRWHIGCMSLSYASSVTLLTSYVADFDEGRTFWFLMTMLFGLAGLSFYWAREVSNGRQ